MKTNLDIDTNGYIVKASNGKTLSVFAPMKIKFTLSG